MAEDAEKQAQARVGGVLDDKWTLERLLGVGGMAAVYGAKHRNGARAAVKVLHPDLSRHKDVRERFLREGYAANKVEHPGAVRVLDDDVVASGPESGTAYLVMELLEGESLQDRLERGPPVGELEFLTIAASVLEVLEAAHARGVVHRDLKPENLFLPRVEGDLPGDRVKVLDFGLARLNEGQAITSYGLALGTPSFMSPEQAAGRIDEIDGRTDLFALAATGFRICTGRRIHEAGNPVDLVRKMASLAAPKVRSVRADVSEPCARVIDRALEFRREDRYATATAMREDVKRAVAELEVSGPTQLALRPPPPMHLPAAPSGEQTTMEVSDTDLRAPSYAADLSPPDVHGMDESVRIPRRPPVLPWLGLAAGLLLAGALWLRHRAATQAAAEAAASAAVAASVLSISDAGAMPAAPPANAQAPVIVRDRDASTDSASLTKPDASWQTPGGASAASSAPPSAHGAPTGKGHKPPKKHHGKKTHPVKSTP